MSLSGDVGSNLDAIASWAENEKAKKAAEASAAR